jgi:multidrug resistance efflux pump
MADDTDGGSNPNTIAQMSIDQALAEKAALENKVKDMQTTIDDLTAQLKAANNVLEAQEKSRLIREILPRSSFTVEELSKKSTEDLQEIRVTLDAAKLPTYKNIHFGPIGADEKEDEGLTVGDLSVVTAAKRKAGRS